MKRSNFTFTFLFAFFGFLLAPLLSYGQCPANPTVNPLVGTEWTANCDGTYDLDWAGNADLFTVVISDAGGATVFGPVSTAATIITNFNVLNSAGAPYTIAITATCGIGTNADNQDLGGYALPVPPTLQLSHFIQGFTPPTCPGSADGTLTVCVNPVAACPTQPFTVELLIGGAVIQVMLVQAGDCVTFDNLPAGPYSVSMVIGFGCGVCPLALPPPLAFTMPDGTVTADDFNIDVLTPNFIGTRIIDDNVIVSAQPFVLPPLENDCNMNYSFSIEGIHACAGNLISHYAVLVDGVELITWSDMVPSGALRSIGAFDVELDGGVHSLLIRVLDNLGNGRNYFFDVEVPAQQASVIVASEDVTIGECEDSHLVPFNITIQGCNLGTAADVIAKLNINIVGDATLSFISPIDVTFTADGNTANVAAGITAPRGAPGATAINLVNVSYDGGPVTQGVLTVHTEEADMPVVVAQSEHATIPQCDLVTEVCLTASVSEACGAVVGGPGAVYNFSGSGTSAISGAVTFSGSGTYNGNGQFEFCRDFEPGNYAYVFEYKGVTSRASVTVNRAADDLPPVVVADDEIVNLNPCQETVDFHYYFTIHDDCGNIDPNLVFFNDGGAGLFGPVVWSNNGTSMTFEAWGDVSAGEYYPFISYLGVVSNPTITIYQEDPVQPDNLACNDVVNISLNSGCMATINADMFTEGSDACARDFTIRFPNLGPGGTALVFSGSDSYTFSPPVGQHIVEIFYPGVEAPCWGYMNIERKIVPDPIIKDREIMCTESTKFIYDRDDVLGFISAGCYADVTSITYSDYDNGDLCEGTLYWERTWRGQATIDGQKRNIVLLVERVKEIPLTIDMIRLPPGGSFDDPVKVWCPYGTSPEDIAAHYSKKCFDKKGNEFIIPGWEYAYPHLLKGTIPSYDRSCRIQIVERYEQEKILIDGKWVIVTVVYKDEIEVCDGPYVVVSEKPNYVPLKKGKTCNIDVKCVDMKFASCTGPETKVMRTWTLLDWCNGTIAEHVQWIKVVDEEDPVINPDSKGKHKPISDKTVGIAPWTCAAEYAVNIPVIDNCDDDVDVKITTSTGQVGSDNVIRGLWKDDSPVDVWITATDACNNRDEKHFRIYVVDNIPPVMIAEDQVNVSLTGDIHGTGTDLGVAKVYTNAIDAGSHDAGCGPVDLCLLLKEELENPIYHPVTGYPVEVDYVGADEAGEGYSIYHAAQCAIDGTIEFEVQDGKGTKTVYYDYVVCKDYVKFCCSDLGDNQVALVGGDHYGNYNHSWTTVTVEDKSTPIVYCADDIELYCFEDYDVDDLRPTVYNSICAGSELDYTTHEDLDVCGQGYIEVIWTLDGEVVCVNYFYYHGGSLFDPYDIRWPKHYTGETYYGIRRECEDDGYGGKELVEYYNEPVAMGDAFECEGDDLQGPVWCEAACSLIGSNSEDLEVDATDACRKIIRRWTVIDWCTWDPNGYSPGDDTNDTSLDNFVAVDDEWLTRDGLEWVYADYRDRDGVLRCEECTHNSGSSDDVYFRYKRVNHDGYYTFDQVIKIIDETAPVIDAPEEAYVDITGGADAKGDDFDGCEGSDMIDATASDLCLESEIDASSISWYIHTEDEDGNVVAGPKSVDGPDATMSTGTGEPGDVHYIYWNVKDGCGNYADAVTEVHFRDVKNPTPVCLQDISTATMNNAEGSVTIWASDYDIGSFDNCSEVDVMFMDSAGNFVPSLTFTCADIPNGVSTTIETQLFVIDESGNYDYCYVTLRIDDNSDACEDVDVGAAIISGLAQDAFGNRLESARILLNQASERMTPVEGTYAFSDNTMFASYVIKAEKNDDFLNGVTTLDVVLLQKHILGLKLLDNPYKVISADVNGSETVTATDIVELRKLILGVYNELPNNKSWRFVDASQVFADANDPFPFTEELKISSLEGPMPNQNFVAAKIGDVSGNAFANSLQAGPRSAGTLRLEVAETTITKGSEIAVDVRGANFADVSGYQFTMEISGLEFTGVEPGALNMTSENFGVLNANTVTTSWASATPISTGAEVLFTMKFRATTDVTLSEGMKVSSRVTEALSYTGTDYAEGTVEMVYGTAENIVTAAPFELGQNEPNPFTERTSINFVLPKAGQATLSVYDVTGKLVVEKAGQYAKGENTITLTKNELGTSGVLYYQLESGAHKATRKMILMN